jgi:pimeloyl-ACP methyl ester carboxylesterase
MASDRSTAPMRAFLGRLGYHVEGFELGRNRPTAELIAALRARVWDLRRRDGRRTSIVGWSLGGIYAREIAREAPQWVRLVVTLGSPFRRVPDAESIVAPILRLRGGARAGRERLVYGDDRPLPVPSTAIFTRSDGIVPWRACLDTVGVCHETLEVVGSHCGLGHHPASMWAIAERLSQPECQWQQLEVPIPWRSFIRQYQPLGSKMPLETGGSRGPARSTSPLRSRPATDGGIDQ